MVDLCPPTVHQVVRQAVLKQVFREAQSSFVLKEYFIVLPL